jgi:hypothetical protein
MAKLPFPTITSDEKRAKRVSMSTTFREREPTNPGAASKVQNFVFDYSRQMDIVPTSFGRDAQVEPNSEGATRTTNAGGRPFALDVVVGGSADARGVIKPTISRPKKRYY